MTERELRGDLITAENAELARLYDAGKIGAATRQRLQRTWTWRSPGSPKGSGNRSRAGQDLVSQVAAWRQQELARILHQLPPTARVQVTTALRQLVEAAGEGYGLISRSLVPV